MEVKNCKGCKKLFNYIGGVQLCPVCREALEDKFQAVKKYIYENPKASLVEISEDNDVSNTQLRQWIREERLMFTEDSVIGIECENCGTRINTGRFCRRCKETLANTLNSAYQQPIVRDEQKKSQNSANRMRFLEGWNNSN